MCSNFCVHNHRVFSDFTLQKERILKTAMQNLNTKLFPDHTEVYSKDIILKNLNSKQDIAALPTPNRSNSRIMFCWFTLFPFTLRLTSLSMPKNASDTFSKFCKPIFCNTVFVCGPSAGPLVLPAGRWRRSRQNGP